MQQFAQEKIMWGKRRQDNIETQRIGNRIEELANRLARDGALDRLEQELLKFDRVALSAAEKESWHHIYGIVPFQQGNRALAFERFQEGLKQCPDSGFLSFSLGQEYEFRADIKNMLALFDRALFPKVPGAYALTQARFAYLWGRPDKALSYIEPILPAYFDLKSLDDHYLYVRGIPFFNQIWAYVAAFCTLAKDLRALKSFTARAEKKCSDFDFDTLKIELKAVETGDYSGVKAMLGKSIVEYRKNEWPVGYISMRYQVLESQGETDLAEAGRALGSVVLGEHDFPWLDDMRLLAECELVRRAGDSAREAELQARFLERQPLLFEPDHALHFNLLAYQESLKPLYQQTRKRNK